jgi:tRNA (guanine-N7-)-methyltransferase
MNESRTQAQRSIRSYVLRQGRLTPGQQRAFDDLWPQFGIPFAERRLDFAELFGNTRPLFIEIGFGNGESLAKMALANPTNNYLGIEVHRPGIGHLLLAIEGHGLDNLRIIRHDAVEVLSQGVADQAVSGLYLFFPDPWHKTKHHKRRIVQPDFVRLLARILQPGGIFHAATDWSDYARQILRLFSASEAFENCAGDGQYAPRPAERPITKFERRGQRLGHGVCDLRFRRR